MSLGMTPFEIAPGVDPTEFADTSALARVALGALLVTACVERLGLTVIHCNGEFRAIAEVTGKPSRWAEDRKS